MKKKETKEAREGEKKKRHVRRRVYWAEQAKAAVQLYTYELLPREERSRARSQGDCARVKVPQIRFSIR